MLCGYICLTEESITDAGHKGARDEHDDSNVIELVPSMCDLPFEISDIYILGMMFNELTFIEWHESA